MKKKSSWLPDPIALLQLVASVGVNVATGGNFAAGIATMAALCSIEFTLRRSNRNLAQQMAEEFLKASKVTIQHEHNHTVTHKDVNPWD